jgi:hypothetical protein
MKYNNSIMNSTMLIENERGKKQASSSHLLVNTASTNQNPYWQTLHDSKSSSQQLTTLNSSEQSSHEKGPPSGTRRHHTTARISGHERED